MPRFVAAFEAHQPDVVLLMDGYSDICCGGPADGQNAAAAVAAIAVEARLRGARVFVANLIPSKPGFRAGSIEALDAFNETIPVYTSNGHDVLVDVFWQLRAELDRNIGSDGLHPTEIGYRRIAQAFYFAIKATLEVDLDQARSESKTIQSEFTYAGIAFVEGLPHIRGQGLRRGCGVTLFLAAACSSNPAAPTAVTPPPIQIPPPVVADPPSITCPPSVGDTASSDAGGPMIFGAPRVEAGATPVSVSCSRASGSNFPVGVTTVDCTATDAMNRTAACSFQVTLTPSPKLALIKFMAFGDSITAGEVTDPIGGVTPFGEFPIFRQIVVPSASYPTVLQRQLVSRFLAQSSTIQMINEGLSGETAPQAVPRFSAAVNSRRPEVVLLLEGYNGVTANGGASGAAAALSAMASEARNRGARVFIATLTPGKPGSRQIPDLFINNYNDRLHQIVRGEGAVLVDLFGALSADVNSYIGIDGLHPNEAGYRKMAETFFAAIRADLER